MALILKDRIKESTTVTGTGDVSLGGSSETFDTFQSVMSNGDTTFYVIVTKESGVDEWEVGLGTWNTGNTLTRTTIYAGSNGTSAVNFSSGDKDIFISYPANKAVVSGEDVTFADITVTGTVDGRDVAADGTKLDGIESGADVTDTTNVTAAGALMDSEVTNLAQVKAFDSSDYATAAQGALADSAQQPPSEGAFVDGDKTKLDGIEASADVTDTANVTAAGALMDSEVTNLAQVKAFDSSDYATAAQGITADAALPKSGGTMTGNLILNADPTTALGAATKEYVDTIAAAGIHYHTPVRVESPDSAGNLNATYDNGSSGVGATLTNAGTQAALVIDGVTLNTNDRVLIYSQTNAYENGVYTVTNTGSASTNWVLTRATDADSYGASDPNALGEGDAYFVKEGDTGAGELYVMNTSGVITFGTTAITFTVIAETAVYSAGDSLTLTGTTFDTVQDIRTTASPEFAGLTISGSIADTTLSTVAGDSFTINVDGVGGEIVLQTNSADRLKLSNGSTELHGLVSINGAFGDRIRFEGNTADAYETTLRVTEPTADRTITFPDATGTIAFNDVATTSANGLMSSSDKTKLNGVETGADVTDTNNVVAALTAGTNVTIAADGTISSTDTNTTYSNATTSTDGLMSSTDKTKLDGVATSANNYSLPLATSSVRGGVKVGYTENGKNYPVELSSEKMFVNVPWTDTNTTYSAGSGISLSGTTFSHSNTSSQSSVANNGGIVIQDVTLDTYGHVTGLDTVNLDNNYIKRGGDTVTYQGSQIALTLQDSYNSGAKKSILKVENNYDLAAGIEIANSTGYWNVFVDTLANNNDLVISYEGLDDFKFTEFGDFYVDRDIYMGRQLVHDGDTNTYIQFGSSLGTGDQMSFYAGGTRFLYLFEGGSDYLAVGVDPYFQTNKAIFGDPTTGTDNETTLQKGSTTAARTITLPDATGTVALTSDIVTYSNATTSTSGLMSSADKTKLDGIETGADVTDTANVTSAGALMDSEVTNLAQVKAFDSADYVGVTGDSMTGALSISQGTAGTASLSVTNSGGYGNNALIASFVGDSDAIQIRNDGAGDYKIINSQQGNGIRNFEGTGGVKLRYNGSDVAGCDSSGGFEVTSGNLSVTNNITVGGTVDGRDVAADGTKLDGIEASADVTDTTNVTAAGALMDSELTSEASVKALDQGVATTDSPTFGGLTIGQNVLGTGANRNTLLEVSNSAVGWNGFSIQASSTAFWSIMGDQDDFGLYDDQNNEWILQYNENSTLQLYSNGTNSVTVNTTGIYLPTNKRIQFEGSSSNSSETILNVVNPTADRTINLPDASGTVLLDTDINVAKTAAIANFLGR